MTLEMMARGPVELAFIGAADDPRRHALERAAASAFLPHVVAAHHDPAGRASTLPLVAGRTAVDGRPARYVCRDYACLRPVTRADEVAGALAAPP
jgi:uncharacterized protein YyaL (SSP411 family)